MRKVGKAADSEKDEENLYTKVSSRRKIKEVSSCSEEVKLNSKEQSGPYYQMGRIFYPSALVLLHPPSSLVITGHSTLHTSTPPAFTSSLQAAATYHRAWTFRSVHHDTPV